MNGKQILKSKRGIALENTILFMLVIFTLCALLTSLTVIGHYKIKIENMFLLKDVEIEQVGDDYLASIAADETFTLEYENYAYSVSESGNALTVWQKSDESKTVVLYVEAELTGGDLKVNKWCYSLPTQTE